MYKILCYLLALMLSVTYGTSGQASPTTPARSANSVETTAINNSASPEFINRKTTFTDHRLADKVETGKNHVYDARVMDRTASLPCPNPYQIQHL